MNRSAIALLLLLAAPFTFAQDRGAGDSKPVSGGAVTGFVTTVSGNLITLLNGAVTIDATGADIHSRKGKGTIADVKPGSQVAITIRNPHAAAGTMLQAANVLILDAPAGTLTGPVQAVDLAESTLTIFGARVRVTPSTQINSILRGVNGTLAQIKAGDLVIVEVSITGSALIAETIHLLPPVPNATLDGTVKSIGATSWVITTTRHGDVTVTVNSSTKIDSAVKVGDHVLVIGTSDAAGHITAMAITRNHLKTPPPHESSLQGTVKSIGPTTWVITTHDGKDVTVTVNASTRIDPTLKVGDPVSVIGRPDATGTIVASAITKADSKRRSSTA